jgi:phosphoribosylformylglycinamidine (FGAM) synthase PurS component
MAVVVRVGIKPKYDDVKGEGKKDYARDKLGLPVEKISSRHLYVMEGVTKEDAHLAAYHLLVDKVVENFEIFETDNIFEQPAISPEPHHMWTVRVGYKINPLVLDAWGDATNKALKDIGINAKSVRHVEEYEIEGEVTGDNDEIEGELTVDQIVTLCKEKLADEKVQQFSYVPKGGEAHA